MKNIEALIAEGGDITIGAIYPIKCAATAADSHNTVATLARRENESLNALLKRLDKAIAYSLNRWDALTAYLDNGDVQIDNNHIENLVRPWAMGRKAWLFAGSELAGQRAAVVMSLLQSAKLHGHDPWAYLKDVLTRLPSHMNSRIDELLPHRWQPG